MKIVVDFSVPKLTFYFIKYKRKLNFQIFDIHYT